MLCERIPFCAMTCRRSIACTLLKCTGNLCLVARPGGWPGNDTKPVWAPERSVDRSRSRTVSRHPCRNETPDYALLIRPTDPGGSRIRELAPFGEPGLHQPVVPDRPAREPGAFQRLLPALLQHGRCACGRHRDVGQYAWPGSQDAVQPQLAEPGQPPPTLPGRFAPLLYQRGLVCTARDHSGQPIANREPELETNARQPFVGQQRRAVGQIQGQLALAAIAVAVTA